MSTRPRLIIVCGLPGAGKTTHAKRLVAELGAVRSSPDEWMDALGIDIYDEEARARIEALQWELTQDLLRLGQTAVIEWGTWSKAERDMLREAARKLGASVELLLSRRADRCPVAAGEQSRRRVSAYPMVRLIGVGRDV